MKRYWVPLLMTLSVPLSAKDMEVAATNLPIDVRLTQTSGRVTLTTRTGDVEGTTVPEDMPLVEGDVIRTRVGSTAEIAISGESLIRLEERSSCRLIHLTPEKTVLGLENGTLLAIVNFKKSAGKHFSVITSNVVAVERGTEFVVQQKISEVRIGVLDVGHVAVTRPGVKKSVLLRFNQETLAKRGRPPEKAQTLQSFYAYKSLMGEMRHRLRILRKHWNSLTFKQQQSKRASWVRIHSAKPNRWKLLHPISTRYRSKIH